MKAVKKEILMPCAIFIAIGFSVVFALVGQDILDKDIAIKSAISSFRENLFWIVITMSTAIAIGIVFSLVLWHLQKRYRQALMELLQSLGEVHTTE